MKVQASVKKFVATVKLFVAKVVFMLFVAQSLVINSVKAKRNKNLNFIGG